MEKAPNRAANKLPLGTVCCCWNSTEVVSKSDDSKISRLSLTGAGKPRFMEYDYEIVESILHLSDVKECATRLTARYIALGISQRENIHGLNASDRWLSRFMEVQMSYRSHYSFR